MKDYDHVIVWTDYFNRNLSRRKGRKVSKDVAIFDPSIQELVDASKSAGFAVSSDNTNETARFPRRPYVRIRICNVGKKCKFEKVQYSKYVSRKDNTKSSQVIKKTITYVSEYLRKL